jgi:hypothetical protein
VRRLLTLLSLALLVLPAKDAASAASRNYELWARMRARGRVAPDSGWDREYRALLPHLPATGPIGLIQALPGSNTATRERHYYFLQYALAPRLVLPGADLEFVVVQGTAANAAAAVDPAAFTLIRRFGDDFALYRRTTR